MPTRELKQQISILKEAGASTENFEVAYHLKYSIPFSALVFILMGVPLGVQRTRDTRTLGGYRYCYTRFFLLYVAFHFSALWEEEV